MSRFVLLPLAAVLLAGCASDSAGPAAPTALTAAATTPRASVIRFDTVGTFVTWDLDRGLLIATGLPAQTTEWDFCPGGTLSSDTISFKENGQRRGVVHRQARDWDASLNVYQLPSDWDFDVLALLCQSSPFAVGTGRFQYLDNDITNTLERVRTANFKAQGIVTVVATGEVLRLTATDHTQFYADGSYVTRVRIVLR